MTEGPYMTIQEWDRQLSGMTPEEYGRAMRRRAWRRRIEAAGEVVAGVFTLALLALAAWLFLVATPDQCSAECEALRAELEAQCK